MRRNTFIKRALIAVMFLLNIISYSQNHVLFNTPRYDQDIRGDMFLIGNNILNRDTNSTNPNDPYNGTGTNNSDFNMNYIDIDGDASTFNSSSALLSSPRPGGDNCYKIRYAGLYWAADLQSGSRTDINKVKFKLPTGGYIDITGTVVYDANPTPIGSDNMKPYACYADVTNLIAPLANPVGNYTVANVVASQGTAGGTGLAAGWTLFLVYEDPTLTSKSIVSIDGFSGIGGATTLTFPVSGFRTIPVGPVRAKFAMSALEGDRVLSGDYLRINGTTITTPERPGNNFFNATINTPAGPFTTRNPNSSNTLGYDAALINVNNPGNAVIGNNVTSANIELGSTGDVYFYFFNAFAVDIIAPEIQLTKDVENNLGTPIGGANVNLGQQLNYVIGFQNIGNDNATSFTIKDILPLNIIFNPADLALPGALPPGVTFTYNATTREIVFTIPNTLVEVGDPRFEINIRVHVVSTCLEMDDACSNLIQNQAFATYSGTFNTTVFSDEGSIASFGACGFGTPGSTNFLVGLDDCNFTRTEIKCGTTPLVLTAANGYQSYVWSGPGTITPVPGTNNQSVTVTSVGTYTVNDIINTSPCKSIVETIIVVDFSAAVTNPAIPVADQIVLCPTNGEQLPYIFLCSAGESQLITTNIANATSISWQVLTLGGACTAVADPRCPNTNPACWSTVSTASNFTVNAAGEYRVVIIFQGGCQRTFYFNVYQNLINPTVATRDIICTNPGQITVNGVPPGYEYLLTPPGTTWQTSNIFPINTAGVYNVDIRQIGVTGGCVIPLSNIAIQARNMTVTSTVTQPSCFPQKGSINLIANGVNPQYTYNLYQEPGHILVNSVGPIVANNYLFSNINSGNYSYQVTTPDGCLATGNFTINNVTPLTVTAALTIPLTCTDGEITIYPVGGTPPYSYFINSATVFQTTPQYVVTAPGTYNIQIVDFNNCSANTSITVGSNPPPVFTVTGTNILCYGDTSGAINFNVTNANGYTLGYSITGGAPFTTNPNFTNLPAGTYSAVVQYTLSGSVCTTTPQTIIITQPAMALTASGGVAAVACASNGGNGIVRITNVQGGTPYPGPNFYQYNFGAGYQNLNQANLPPGTYTIYVRDANLCVFPMTVTLDPIPPDPTISVGAPTFSCSGSATSTVTVNNGTSSYSYQYTIDVPLTPPHDPNSNVFTNVPCGPHVVTVNYTLVTPATFSNLLREDFGVGDDTTSPGINPGYCFERQISSSATWCNGSAQINDGDYSVTKRILFPYGAWYPFVDHTTNGTNPNARFLAINIGGVAGTGGILYSKPISDIIPNQDIKVSLWAANLLKIDPGNTQSPPDLTIQLVKDLGLPSQTVIASSNTGNIPKSNIWINYNLSLNPGANTNLSFVVRSNISVTNGNDVVIDDINVFQLPVACLTTRNFPINIPCNQAFSAQVVGHHDVSCAGLNDATVTVAAQNFNTTNGFQISMDNGVTWTTHFTSPATVPVTAGYPGFVLVRFDAAPANAACTFNLPQIIITPSPLVASAVFTPVTCATGSTITASATGGTPAYQYQLTNSGGTVIVAFQASPIFTNIPSGSYIVVIRDVNLCTANFPLTISAPVAPTATISPASDFCYDGTNAASLVVTAAGGVAPYTVSINGSPYGPFNGPPNTHTFGSLTPGTYTIIVRDAYGCSVTLPAQTIALQLTISASLTKDLDCNSPSNAIIGVAITGGYPTYQYQVNINGAGYGALISTGTPFNYPAASAGTYQFQVTDIRGCIAQSNVITINPLIPISATNAVTNVTCNGLSNGSVTITPSGGVAPYQINFNGAGFNAATTYSNLPAGTYNYIVRDFKNCTFNGSVTITQPAPIVGTATLTTQFTCVTSGVITVSSVSGGTAPYLYSMNGGPFGPATTFTITAAGTYTITIRDANGCTLVLTPIVVAPLNPPTDLSFAMTALTCPANTSNVTVTVTGTNTPYTYQMLVPPGAPQASNVYNNLPPGTYTLQVTDSKNCTYQENFTISPLPVLGVTGVLVSNVRCFGTSTGSATFTVTNSTGFTYTLNGVPQGVGTSPIILTNQPAGTYTVVVTNTATNCTATASVTITQPASALVAPVTIAPIRCGSLGQVTVNASGGWGGYTYVMVPMPGGVTQSGNVFSNIPAGSYTMNTTDSGGCTVSTPFTLTNPTPPTASISAASDFCYDSTDGATIVVTAAGGVPPYTYTNNGGIPQSSNTFTPLTPGTYNIVVTDSFGCTVALAPQTINQQLSLTSFVLTKDLDCTLSPNAVIDGAIAGGYPLYTCLVNVNGGGFITAVPVTAGGTFTYSTALAGTYQFLITDTRGCTVQSGVITINPLIPVSATHTQVNNTCFGATSGSVTITPSGGVAPYQINFNGLGFSSTTTYTGLVAGTYNYIVRDSKSCTFNGSVTITEPTQIVYTAVVNPISCNPLGGPYILGSICVNSLGGGVAPYVYTLVDLTGGSPNQVHADAVGANFCFPNVDFGQYDLIVTDANGCTIVKSNLIMSNPPNDLTFVINPVLVSCAAGATVDVTLVGAIGPGPFEFGIVNLNVFPWSSLFVPANNPPFSHQFTGLTPGATYTIVVRDIITGCYYFEQMTASTPTNSTMTVSSLVANPVPCRGGNNGSATFSLSGVNAGAASVTYTIHYASNNVQLGAPVTIFAPYTSVTTGPLAPGTYNIQFTENGGPNSGCGTTSTTFTIVESATDLTLSAITRNDNCNVNAGQIAPSAVGGTGPYTFQYLITGSPAPTAASLLWTSTNPYLCDNGTYDVYVKDAYGCIRTVTVTVGFDTTPIMTATLNNACAAEGAFAITVALPTPGIAPHTYSIDNGAYQVMATPFTISGLSSGPHSVEVRDFNGCGNRVDLTISPPLIVSSTIAALPGCANNDGSITVNASGGSGSYSYSISPVAGTLAGNVFSNLPAGTYDITVNDLVLTDGLLNPCTKTIRVVLSAPTPVTFSTTVNNVDCNGGSDGTITVNLTSAPDNPVYTYQITAPAGPWVTAPTASNVFTGLPAGTYTVVVTPGRGCPVTDNNVVVGQPAAVAIQPIPTVTFNCAPNNTVNTASFTVTVVGGTAPYTYSIDNVNYFTTPTFTISDTGAVSLTVYVKDANGCTDTEVVTITPLPALVSATIVQDIAITCINPEQVHVNVVGGSGNFSYQLLPSGAAQASNVFNLPAPGTYVIQVNDLTTNCYISSAPYTVGPFNTATVVATQTAAATCFGNSNGAISINITGYSGAYSYDVYDMTPAIPVVVLSGVGNTAVNPQPIVGLPAGNYTVQVTETASPRCVITSNAVSVSTPSAVALTLISNVNAYCTLGAQVTVSGSGGTPGYTYAFVQNAVIPVPGDYTASNSAVLDPAVNTQWDVYVKDANGCITFIDVTIAFDPVPTISVPTFAADQCTSTGSSFTFTATGTGLAPLTYSIGTGFQASGTFTVFTTGTYTVTIKDRNGCTASGTITIYPVIGITPSVTALPSCANNEGQITVSANGGSGSYNYTLLDSTLAIIAGPQASNVFGGLAAGSYTVTVTDLTTTCTKDVPVVLGAPTPVTFTTTVDGTSCNGGSDGTITVNLTSAPDNPVYTYQITAPAGPWVGAPQTSNIFTGLPAGTYTVVVTPGRGCAVTDNNVVVGQPTVVAIPAATVTQFGCAAGTNVANFATITVNGVTGGSGVYTNYEFILGGVTLQSGASNTFTTTDLAGGTYTINVYDDNGCLGSTSAVINPFVGISNPVVTVTSPVTCTTTESILVSVTTTGVSPVLTYTINSIPAGFTQTNNTGIFNGLVIGDYSIVVTNPVTNCSVETIHYVFNPNTFGLTVAPNTNVTCVAGNEGSVLLTIVDNDLTPTNDAGPFSFVVTNINTGLITNGNSATSGPTLVQNLTAGLYTVTVTLTNIPNCPVTSSFTINEPATALTLIANESANVTCTDDQGIITALASGGWGTYEYELVAPLPANNVPFSSNNVFTGLSAGNYTINVRDLLGCPVSTSVLLVNPGIINATFTAAPTTLACNGDTNATITATVLSGGQMGNYTYTLNSGNPTFSTSGPQVSPVFTGLGAGSYTITITDGYNCGITSAPIVINDRAPVQAQLNVTTGVTCFQPATLTLTAQGGTAPYGYSVNAAGPFTPFNAGNSTTIPVPVGTYNYYVQDANLCMGQSNDAQVDALQPLVFSAPSHTDILCPGSFGSISIAATGGLLNYVYTLYDALGNPIVPAPTQTTPGNFTGLVAGDYIVHVTSVDCTRDSAIITIAEPPTFVATPTPTDLKCNGVDDGSIHFDIVGGSGQFQYAIGPDIQQFFNIPSTGFDITGLGGPTTYHIIIRDGIHCPQEFDVFINEPAPVATTYGVNQGETCAELDDAFITINNITGGFAPYSISYNLIGNTPSAPVVITSFPYVIDNLNGGEYEIIVTDANGCPSYPPNIILGDGISYDPLAVTSFLCVANKPTVIIKIINLNNPPSFDFIPAADYMFSLDDPNPANAQQTSPIFSSADWPNLLTPGTHIGYVFTSSCDKATPPVTVNPTDVSQLTLTLTHVELNQIIANVNNSGTPPYNYTFNGHDNGSNPIYVYDHAGTYHVVVTDSRDGCSAEADILVPFTPIFIPPVFTPDGNGEHDTWSPENTSNYKNLKTLIYDRYGRKVAELGEGQGWDGKYNEKELPSGDYWYVIKVDGNEDQEFVGHFTLYR